jgi:CBS domain-containing protein
MELKEILKEAVTIGEHATFKDALRVMVEKQSNSLLVIDGEGKLVGEISVSDLMDAILPEYLDGDTVAANFATEEMFEEAVKNAAERKVSSFMSKDIDAIQTDDNLMKVAATAIARKQARIPVVDAENRPVGIISRRGLKQMVASFLKITDNS